MLNVELMKALDAGSYGVICPMINTRAEAERRGVSNVETVIADCHALPFADASLDAVVMFATLHHFPDPVRLLRHLRTKLAPGGLICVLCEPVSHVAREDLPDDYRKELLDGICEQAL